MFSDLKYSVSTITLFTLLLNYSNCQLIIDTGPDTTHCMYPYIDTIYLSPNLSIEGGINPYTFIWEGYYRRFDGKIFWGSSFINDTTIANPYFISRIPNEWIKFVLHVWDNDENYEKDSIKVRFSNFAYIYLDYDAYLSRGDSFQFFMNPLIGAGISPLSICYVPEYGLTDPCSLTTWCKPDSTTYYYQVATDSVGCVSEEHLVYRVFVFPAFINNNNFNYKDNKIQKVGNKIIFENPYYKPALAIIYSLNGTTISILNTKQNFISLTQINLSTGIYIVQIRIENQTFSTIFNY